MLSFGACLGLGPPALIGAAWGTWEAGIEIADASVAVPGGVGISVVVALIVAPLAALFGFVASRFVF